MDTTPRYKKKAADFKKKILRHSRSVVLNVWSAIPLGLTDPFTGVAKDHRKHRYLTLKFTRVAKLIMK